MIATKPKIRAGTTNKAVVKIGGVEVTIRSHPSKGKIPVKRFRSAVTEVLAALRKERALKQTTRA